MKRLNKMTCPEMGEWRKTRAKVGRNKYKNKHLNRYNLVDVMEEILDAENIIELFEDRLGNKVNKLPYKELLPQTKRLLREIKLNLCTLDMGVDDKYCTDEEGGDRIWWHD